MDPLPAAIPVSQPVTITMHRGKSEPLDPFVLRLVHKGNDGLHPEFFAVTDPARDTLQATIAVTATGLFQIEAAAHSFDRTAFFTASQSVLVVDPTQTSKIPPTGESTSKSGTGDQATTSTDSSPTAPPVTSSSNESLSTSGPTSSSDDPISTSPNANPGSDTSSPRMKTTNNTAIIVGSVIGGVVAIILLILLLFLIFRRCRRRRAMQTRDNMNEEIFYKDRMVVERRISINGTGVGVGFNQEGKDTRRENLDPDSPITPLREGFEDRPSAASSLNSADSAAASRIGSGINSDLPPIETPPLESMFGSGRLVESSAPLIPTPSSPTPFRTPSRARTDRQMLIEQKILELQGRLITAKGSEQEKTRVRAMLKERIEKVKELRESDWALHEGSSGGDMPDILRG